MDRSYIVEAQVQQGAERKDVIAVVFLNSEPSKGLLADLGLSSISGITESRPETRQPTEPTMYVFERSSPVKVVIKRFDYNGKLTMTTEAHGEPHALVPPVSGGTADSLLYAPKAHIISGLSRDGSRLNPVVGVLFVKPQPKAKTLKADKQTLARMGFDKIISVDPVHTCACIPETTLFIFERTPAANAVRVVKPSADGSVDWRTAETKNGEPHTNIPPISGSAADRFVYPRNGLGKSDFPRPATVPPGPAEPGKKLRA